MKNNSTSPGKIAFRKFLRDKLALGGLIYIIIAIFVSVFAYYISPDHSPDANNISLPCKLLPPGTNVKMLALQKKNLSNTGFFDRLLNGEEESVELIPIDSYTTESDGIHANLYTGAGSENHPMRIISKDEKFSVVEKKFILGSDQFGRDQLSRLLLGTRISLSAGLLAVSISVLIGLFMGSIAGFFPGWPDKLINWLISVTWSVPALLLVIAITMALGKGLWQVFFAIGITMWVEIARVVRGQILVIREMEYVEAGRVLGFGNARIIIRHVLPNIMGPVIVMAASNFAAAILLESGLSFLGLGAQPPSPSWGSILKENYSYLVFGQPWLALAPGFAIMLLVLSINFIGNGLRDALDTKAVVSG